MPNENQQPTSSPEEKAATGSNGPKSLAVTLGICAAGWLVPGTAHLFLGRWVRAAVFTISILTMFGLGLAMQGRLYDMRPEQPLHIFAFIANAGVGAPYILAERMGLGLGVLSNPSYDYGNTYLWVSGLLNYLIVLDAFDIARGRKP